MLNNFCPRTGTLSDESSAPKFPGRLDFLEVHFDNLKLPETKRVYQIKSLVQQNLALKGGT